MTNSSEIKKRLLSGIQPTGKMHLGNYLGAVSNWVELQHKYDSFFVIVDLHALTSVYDNPERLRRDKFDLAVDLISAGIDPEKCCLYYQSDVPEHSELHLILSMITPLPWLTRVPTYKGKIEEMQDKDLNTYGFLGYPVLQAADIILFKANIVPVGKDQLPHLEIAREIIRRFHSLYKQTVFPEPEPAFTEFPVLPGTDGRKMSKSYGNTIPVSTPADEMRKLVMGMFTDPNRKRRTDPGNPDICPVFTYHKIFNTQQRQEYIDKTCREAKIGCVECKKELADMLVESLAGFRKKREELLKDPAEVDNILRKGAEKARHVASETLTEVKRVIGI